MVTISPDKSAEFETTMANTGYFRLGTVTAEKELIITGLKDDRLMAIPVAELKEAWQKTLDF